MLTRSTRTAQQIDAFFNAIATGTLAEVQHYVNVLIDVKELKHKHINTTKYSPLCFAAKNNRLEIVQFFVETGHDKEVGCGYGISPIWIAAVEGHMAVVRYLVEQGADKDKARDDGMTPLIMAASNGHFTVVQYLVEGGRRGTRPATTAELPSW